MPLSTLVVIASSTGGPGILRTVFRGMPALDAAVVIVQHMPQGINASLCDALGGSTPMTVRLARHGEVLLSGIVYIAPSKQHLRIPFGRVRLEAGPSVNYVCPAADVTMGSLRGSEAELIVGVSLTGMGRDGAAGLVHIRDLGGITIAQDEATSPVWGMPRAAIETGCVDLVLPPDAIRETIIELTRNPGAYQLAG